jgi:hypothetical protein
MVRGTRRRRGLSRRRLQASIPTFLESWLGCLRRSSREQLARDGVQNAGPRGARYRVESAVAQLRRVGGDAALA